MWLPGHIAIGLLLSIIPLVLYSHRARSWALPLSYIAFFSVLPDFLHIGELRAFSHSIAGATVMLVIALLIVQAIQGWKPLFIVIATIAMASHLIADTYIGHIYPWWPWSMEMVQYSQFNTLFDIRTELELCAVACVPLALLILAWPRGLRMDGLARRDLLALLALLAPFSLFTLAQTIYYVEIDVLGGVALSIGLLMLAFLVALLSGLVALGRSIRAFSRSISSPKGISILPDEYYRYR
jgi:hypothetical protein